MARIKRRRPNFTDRRLRREKLEQLRRDAVAAWARCATCRAQGDREEADDAEAEAERLEAEIARLSPPRPRSR